MLRTQDDLDSLIERAYEAALNPQLWAQFLRDLAAGIGASSAATLWFDERHHRLVRGEVVNIDPDALEQYAVHYVRICPRYALGKAIPAGGIYDDQIALEAERQEWRDYYAWAKHFNLDRFLGLNVERSSTLGSAFLFYRPAQAESFDESERKTVQHIATHLRRAARLSMKVIEGRAALGAYGALFDCIDCPAILVNNIGQVLETSGRAADLLHSTEAIRVKRGQEIEIRDRSVASAFRSALKAALAGPGTDATAGAPIMLWGGTGEPPLAVSVCPIPTAIRGEAASYYSLPSTPRAIVTLSELRVQLDQRRIQSLFRLTVSEADVVAKLVAGDTVEDIATSRSVSEGTVRVQLRSIYSKVGASTQAQLVSRVMAATRSPWRV